MTRYSPRRRQLGFTIVELMMSLAVLTVGISGIIAMQRITALSNQHSKSVAMATQIANSWQDQLLLDGSIWRTSAGLAPQAALANTTWLTNGTNPGVWFRPNYNVSRLFGSAFDALGNALAPNDIAQAQFCVHLLMVPVVALTGNNADNATFRVTVRVLWPRANASQTGTTNFCANDVDTVAQATDTYHSLYQTFAIRVRPS